MTWLDWLILALIAFYVGWLLFGRKKKGCSCGDCNQCDGCNRHK